MKEHPNTDYLYIHPNAKVIDALKQMDSIDHKLLIVYDDQFIGLLSIGDIQRGIIGGYEINAEITGLLRENLTVCYDTDNIEYVKDLMIKHRAEYMPIIHKDSKKIQRIVFWEDFFPVENRNQKLDVNLPVVIMAGGKGTRLKPITNVIPKPLIPVGDKTIIEEIMDRFIRIGASNFILSVNYKAETIKHYFNSVENNKYDVSYIEEKEPLGTAGSLYLLKDNLKTTFFVSNCDIIIDEDYHAIFEYHRKFQNELTIVAALKHYKIPYGTISTGKNGELQELQEKPEFVFQINSGLYILEPHLLEEIPIGQFFHITELIEQIKNRKGKVGVFPVSEGSWRDMGDWNEYLGLIKKDTK